jgi:hypothetical protein
MGHGGHSLLARGMYALQLDPWLQEYQLEKDIMVLDINDIKGSHQDVQATMDKVYRFIGVPTDDVQDIQAKNSRSYEPMSAEVGSLLLNILFNTE